jgi:hypothetical protein
VSTLRTGAPKCRRSRELGVKGAHRHVEAPSCRFPNPAAFAHHHTHELGARALSRDTGIVPAIAYPTFDASADFHVYSIDWNPAGASFSIDDEVRHTWTKNIRLMDLPQNVLLTIWASSSASWAGAVTEETAQAVAEYDWVELYEYEGP